LLFFKTGLFGEIAEHSNCMTLTEDALKLPSFELALKNRRGSWISDWGGGGPRTSFFGIKKGTKMKKSGFAPEECYFIRPSCFLNDLYQYLDQSEFEISSSSSFKKHSGRMKCVGDS